MKGEGEKEGGEGGGGGGGGRSSTLILYLLFQRQFEDQVDIQMKLEEIAVELKQRCADDHGKMQSLLPELLEAHGVPTFTLTPVYNPRSVVSITYSFTCTCGDECGFAQW